MEERREELQRFGAWSGLALINPQQRRLIAPERRHQRLARRIELAQIVRGGLDRRTRAAELVAQAIAQADADRKNTRLNSSHQCASRMPSSARKKQHRWLRTRQQHLKPYNS